MKNQVVVTVNIHFINKLFFKEDLHDTTLIISGWLRLQETGAWNNIIAKYSHAFMLMENMQRVKNRPQEHRIVQVGIAFVGYVVALAAVLVLLVLEFVFKCCFRIK